MNVKFYTINCPKCNILKRKLDEKGITYELISDTEEMIKKGFKSSPMLEYDETYTTPDGIEETRTVCLEFTKAIKWVNEK